MLKLNKQDATLKYTPRVELHGDDTEPGCTLTITMRGNNVILDQLDPGLRETFFVRPETDDQDLADQGASEEMALTRLRHPALHKKKAFAWDYQTGGCRVVIGGCLFEDDELIFINCDVKNFSFELIDGGVVMLKFNINCSPTQEEAGRLYEINGSSVEVTLEPPKADAQMGMELETE